MAARVHRSRLRTLNQPWTKRNSCSVASSASSKPVKPAHQPFQAKASANQRQEPAQPRLFPGAIFSSRNIGLPRLVFELPNEGPLACRAQRCFDADVHQPAAAIAQFLEQLVVPLRMLLLKLRHEDLQPLGKRFI